MKGENYDSFKFVIEKNVDFHDIDVEIFLKAYEEAFKPKLSPIGMGADKGKSTNQAKPASTASTGIQAMNPAS